MKNRIEHWFLFFLVPLDFLMIILASLLAYYLRFTSFFISYRPVRFYLDFTEYLFFSFDIAFLIIFILALNGGYSVDKIFYKLISKIFTSVSTAFLLILLYLFIVKDNFESRFILLFAWFSINIAIILGRYWLFLLRKLFYRKNKFLINVLLLGNKEKDRVLMDYLKENANEIGYKLYDVLDLDYIEHNLEFVLKHNKIDEIWYSFDVLSKNINNLLMDLSYRYNVVLKFNGNSLYNGIKNLDLQILNGIPFIELKKTPLEAWWKIAKRIIDILGSIVAIVIFSPIMIVTAIAIKFTSKGPILADIPNSAGQYGKEFRFFKFRSMYVGAHKDQAKLKSEREGLFKLSRDPRITKVGHFIRKWSIDELPQFFNVLLGDMSLVGPRPHFPYEYKEEYKRVLLIKPGITGLSQISGRSDLSFEDEVKLDLYYIAYWSIWLDFWILLKTPMAIFKNRLAS